MPPRSRKTPATPDPAPSSEPSTSQPPSSDGATEKALAEKGSETRIRTRGATRSGPLLLILLAVIANSSWAVYRYQYDNLPAPLASEQAGKRGFSEVEAMKHVKALTDLGPHPVGSDALEIGLQYVLAASEKIKKNAHWEVDVDVDYFHVQSGASRLVNGQFKGRTLVYSDLTHIVLRISPKYVPEATESAILISSHIDTVFSTEGAGDCSSCVAVMLELARGVSQWAHGFKNSVIFLFNTGEEEGLNGAHSFITQHPWSPTVRVAVDLEAMGIGGKSGIFQAGPHSWAIEKFASAAKYPSAQIIAQDLFASGVIKSATDFQIYKEVAGLSGLDFAYADNSAVYHTKNDKLKLLKPGSLQHLGENMLAFLLQAAPSSDLPKDSAMEGDEKSGLNSAIYFDILGTYMIVYHQPFANMLHNSVIMQSLLLWTASLLLGGTSAAISLALSLLSIALMWIFSLGFSIIVAVSLPLISSSPVPYVASPWLVVGIFATPAFLGALTGQHLGYLILQAYLSKVYKRKQQSPIIQADLIKLEAERWIYKAGLIQWFVLLVIGNYYKLGSSYLALVWLVPPAFAYGFLEATLTPARLPKPLKLATLLLGLAVPVLMSAGILIQLASTMISMVVRFDRNPGSTPEWLGNVIIACLVALMICLTLVYFLSYTHLSGGKRPLVLASCVLFGLSLSLVLSGTVPPFTEDTARAVNVVHIVDTTGGFGREQEPSTYVSFFSTTPGQLTNEAAQMKEGFVCSRDKVIDFVTFSVKYGCWSSDDTEDGWSESDIPTLQVASDTKGRERITKVLIDTKSSIRWALAINFMEIDDFSFEDNSELVPYDVKSSVDGWHTIQYSGGKNAPRRFNLTLLWAKNSTQSEKEEQTAPLLKLRTDMDILTPKVERVLEKLPPWYSQFGKSTSPHNFAFLANLPVKF